MKEMKNKQNRRPYGVLTAVLVVVFFLVGFFTLGSFSHTGEAYYVTKDTQAVFALEYGNNQNYLKDVYINVGSVYAADEGEAVLTVRTSTSKTSTADSTWTALTEVDLSKSGVKGEGGLFNWVNVASDLKKKTAVYRVCVTVTAGTELNEIICIADNGKPITLSVAEYGNDGVESVELEKALDAQASFTNKQGAYYNFTEEEGTYLSYIRNLGLGSQYYGEDVYAFAQDFGAIAVLIAMPSVLLFGESAFALRLPSLIATTLTVIGLAMLFTLLFKDEKYGFLAAFIFAFGGLALSVGRMGAPYAYVACALVYAAYFAYKFFAKGISERRISKDGSSLFFAGAFAAVAVAIEGMAILPVVGVAALIAVGLIRQKKAHVYAIEKISAIDDEERRKVLVRKENINYKNKVRVGVGYSAFGFVICYFLLVFLSTIVCHNAYVRVYGANVGFATLVWKNIAAGFSVSTAFAVSAADKAIAFAWFLPLKATTLYAGSADGAAAQWLALANPVLTMLALVAFVYTTVMTVKNFKATDKKNNRVRRVYFVLLGGAVLTVLAALIKGVDQTTGALAFYAAYYGFILLGGYLLSGDGDETVSDGENTCRSCKCCKVLTVCVWVVVALSAVCFVLALPAALGFSVPSWWAKLIGFASIL